MTQLTELERLLALLRAALWPLVWLLEQRQDLVVLIGTGFVLVVLYIAVQRKIAFDKRARYKQIVWRNSQPAVVHKQAAQESLGFGFRRILAVVSSLMLFFMWFACQVAVFAALGVQSNELQSRPGFALLPIGISVVALLSLSTIHTLFVSRKRADKEYDHRISKAYTPTGTTTSILGPAEPDKYSAGYGTAVFIFLMNTAYIVGMLALYAWMASLAA
jgi:hypothetical protein